MSLTLQKWIFCKCLYGENDKTINMEKMTRETYSQTIIRGKLMLNALQVNQKKIIPYRPFHRAIDETFKIPEIMVAFAVSEFWQGIPVRLYQPTLERWLSLLYVYK